MNEGIRHLFHELVDLEPGQQQSVLAERGIAPEVRAEVESLLRFAGEDDRALTDRVADAAEEAIEAGIGRQFRDCGPYRLVRLLGSGGMGEVYLGERRDGELEQKVAVKLLRAGADRPIWRDRFLKERQLLASLNHPAIARVMDAGHTCDGRPYLVMEYVDGVPIDTYAAGKPLRDQLTLFLRVCDAVAHAHGRLIIHRDLKPSNILVDSSGQPKLLDFGIAKLLDETGEATQTKERLLTPLYASPEQMRGATQTTATDVYSLGGVLYKLLAGRSPHETDEPGVQAVDVNAGTSYVVAPSRWNRDVPGDLDSILSKALRYESEERYRSVEALATDIRAFLEWRPVAARSGNAWYRTRRFLRRRWMPMAAAAITIAGLSLGLYTANRERAAAQRRFLQVRQLANKVLALDGVVSSLRGTTKVRHELVAMSQQYLEALGAEARSDPELALEIAEAYTALASAQGVPNVPNLGQSAQAAESLRKASELVERVLAGAPRNRRALLAAAEIAEDRMLLADSDLRHEESLSQAGAARDRLEALLGQGRMSQAELAGAARIFINVASAYERQHRFDATIRYARRAIEMARMPPANHSRLASAYGLMADAMRVSGDLEGAQGAIREASANLAVIQSLHETTPRQTVFNTLFREGLILGEDGQLNLGRPDEAMAAFQKAMDMAETWADADPNDATSRNLSAMAGRELAKLVRYSDPQRALAIYDHALLRLSEMKNDERARREKGRLLNGSSYVLRSLHRMSEAKDRIDSVFRLLRETRDYPTDRIHPDDPVDGALRALATHYAETGQPQRAAEIYQELLDKIMAVKPDPQNDLRHAIRFSQIYAALADLDRRNGQADRAQAMAALRLELWRHWDGKLPHNPFVESQLAAVR